MAEKKLGRPTDNPKPFRIHARIDAECKKILDAYMEQENVPAMEAIRRAIKKLQGDLKEK